MPLAFIDDSGSGGDSPYYVLAGYSADETTWAAFWPLWQAALDSPPKLEYFKMSEAESLKGQFEGFTPEGRTARLNQFIGVILACDVQEASVVVPDREYHEIVYPVMHRNHASPYYFAFIAMVSALAAINRYSGSADATDFIFDEQCGIQNKAIRMYHLLKSNFPERQFGRVAYRTDKQMLALQAADLIAWQIRRFRCTPAEPLRDELRRLHSGTKKPYHAILRTDQLQKAVSATVDNIPNLRQEFGDERVDRFLAGIEKRNRRERLLLPDSSGDSV